MLETERLLLRPWKDDDAEVLYELAKDPELEYRLAKEDFFLGGSFYTTSMPPMKTVSSSGG